MCTLRQLKPLQDLPMRQLWGSLLFLLCRGTLVLLSLLWLVVPKKGLEPPHPCEYMDLNHARLPIPPLRLIMMAQP
jgi:hypothetical protein